MEGEREGGREGGKVGGRSGREGGREEGGREKAIHMYITCTHVSIYISFTYYKL